MPVYPGAPLTRPGPTRASTSASPMASTTVITSALPTSTANGSPKTRPGRPDQRILTRRLTPRRFRRPPGGSLFRAGQDRHRQPVPASRLRAVHACDDHPDRETSFARMARRGLRANGDAVRECLSRNQASRSRRPQCADEPRAHAPVDGRAPITSSASPVPNPRRVSPAPSSSPRDARLSLWMSAVNRRTPSRRARYVKRSSSAAQAEPLPVVRDGDRDLGNLAIVGRANVARDA